jgi:hypothetical protein
MTTLTSNFLTLADWAKRVDPDGNVPVVAELLSQTNEILEDALFTEGNLPTGHRVNIRTGLPSAYWRSINQGVPTSKSTTAQVDESIGMLEAYARIDKDLALLNGNTAAFRLSEDSAFLEAMNQTQAETLFYGNPSKDPRQYLGLSPRYGSVAAGNSQNIIDGQGTLGNNASIWLVAWGENSVFCTFPKGSEAGLVHTDQGELTVYDANGNPYQALQTHYQWKSGLVVKDWRYVVRIANINMANLTSESAAADIVKLMSRALDRIPNMGTCKPAFYMNRTMFSMLRIQSLNKSQNVMSIAKGLDQFGQASNWLDFLGVPMRKVDQLLNTEGRVM